MVIKRKMNVSGMGLWLLRGMAAGAAVSLGVCGTPGKRKVRRRLMRAADAVSDAMDNLYGMLK